MPQVLPQSTLVLAGHGYDQSGPYLLINNVEEQRGYRFPVFGLTFSLKRLSKRFCTGRFNLETFEKSACPLHVELPDESKETMCPACIEATGFNPSFYYSDYISSQQRAYNQTPHYTYLAYFSPQHVKAGISSETRGLERLLEQGARSACVVGRFENADKARELEASLCTEQGILETMRSSLKAKLLCETRFDPSEAQEVLESTLSRIGIKPAKPAQDLSPFYFGGASPNNATMLMAEDYEQVCAGRCVGMVGYNLVLEQGGMNFVAPLKNWESYSIELHEGEVCYEYAVDPQQDALF